jgi:apolipoprotein N-acyltransferase
MYLIYPFLSSVLFILSFPYNFSGYLAFIALTPLFFSISLQSSQKKTAASGAMFGLFISLYFCIPLYYSVNINSPDNPIPSFLLVFFTVIIPNTIIYSLFAVILHWTYKTPQYQRILLPASSWILIDYIKELSSFMLPWGYAGYTQVFTPFIQLADITGIHGISFIIILFNSIITEAIILARQNIHIVEDTTGSFRMYKFLKQIQKLLYKKQFLFYILLCTIITFSILVYDAFKKKNIITKSQNSEIIRYLIVQGNTESVDRWNESTSAARYQTYIQLTDKKIKEADYIVWPETVLNSSDNKNFEIMSGVSANIHDTAFFITGGIRRDSKGNTYNSIFVMGKNNLEYIYDKKILFPYSERPFFGNSSGAFLNSPEKFSEGTTQSIYKTGKIPTGFSICFESIFPYVSRKQARSGANLLINVANDSWFGDSSVPYIQQYAVIARAIENRISIIRSANSGISFAVSPAGEIITTIPLNTRDISFGILPITTERSFYSNNGDWFIIITVIIILFSLAHTEIEKQKG